MIQKNNQNTVADFSCQGVCIDLLHDKFEDKFVVIELVSGGVPVVTKFDMREEAIARFKFKVRHWCMKEDVIG